MYLKIFHNKCLKNSKALDVCKEGQLYLYRHNYNDTYNVNYLDNEVIYVKDMKNNKIVALIAYDLQNDHYWLTLIYIIPEYRGKGIFRLMMKNMARKAIRKNVNLKWGVHKHNKHAINSYKKIGSSFLGMMRTNSIVDRVHVCEINPYKLL